MATDALAAPVGAGDGAATVEVADVDPRSRTPSRDGRDLHGCAGPARAAGQCGDQRGARVAVGPARRQRQLEPDRRIEIAVAVEISLARVRPVDQAVQMVEVAAPA